MNTITKSIFVNAQPTTLLMGVGSVFAGLTASSLRGGFAIFPALLTLLFVVFMQIAANLRYGYSDMTYMMGENFAIATVGVGKGSGMRVGAHMRLMKIMSNGFALLALTAGMPLLEFIGWTGALYATAVILAAYFTFSGPKPLIRTIWSLLVTFIVFGPVCVSGTALIENPSPSAPLIPIWICSLIGGLLAVNAHIAIGYTRYREDLMNNKTTITVRLGRKATRSIYLADSLVVAAAIAVGPYMMSFPTPWLGIPVALCLVGSALAIFIRMRSRPSRNSMRIRIITGLQYIVTILLMLAVTMANTDARYMILHFAA